MLSPSGFSPSDPLSFVRFSSGSGYSASVLPFPSSWPRLSVAFPVLRIFLSASPLSTISSARFPVLPFRFLVLGFLFVSFHPTPVSLPQLLTPALPFFSAFFRLLLFRDFRLLSAFFRPLQPASDYSAFCTFLSPLPVLPWQRFLRCLFSPSIPPVSMRFFRFWYSAFCDSFHLTLFRLTAAFQRPSFAPIPFVLFALGRSP